MISLILFWIILIPIFEAQKYKNSKQRQSKKKNNEIVNNNELKNNVLILNYSYSGYYAAKNALANKYNVM